MEIVQIAQTAKTRDVSGLPVQTARYGFDARYDLYATPDTAHRLVDSVSIDEQCAALGADVAGLPFYTLPSGWQSWAAGWELVPGKNYPQFRSWVIPALKTYLFCPQVVHSSSTVTASLMLCLRFTRPDGLNRYFVMLSSARGTPPVQFTLDYTRRTVLLSVYATGKLWQHDETVAEIHSFCADSYFAVKDTLAALFGADFSGSAFLFPEAEPAVYPDKKGGRFLPGGWQSWYSHYSSIHERLILEDAEYLCKTGNFVNRFYLDKKRPAVFQIDDGWQLSCGDWRVNPERFPQGLAPVAQKLRAAGLVPGLWIAPFIVDGRTDFFREHSAWILKDTSGRPVHAGYNPAWGKKPYPVYYCLDLSRGDVLSYLAQTMRVLILEWGFNYLKLDFLFAGMLHGDFAEGGAAYEHYGRALEILTQIKTGADGKPVTCLGCGMPFENSLRALPLCRIGADTRESWDRTDLKILRFNARPSAHICLRDTLGHSLWNRALCIADPDVFFLRSRDTTLSEAQKETIALVNYMFASQLMLSDDPVTFDEQAERALTEKILALFEELSDEDFGNYLVDTDVYAVFSRSGNYCGLINLCGKMYPVLAAAGLRSGEFDGALLLEGRPLTARLIEKNGAPFLEPYSTALYKRHP